MKQVTMAVGMWEVVGGHAGGAWDSIQEAVETYYHAFAEEGAEGKHFLEIEEVSEPLTIEFDEWDYGQVMSAIAKVMTGIQVEDVEEV